MKALQPTPRVSVLMTTFNGAARVETTLNSVLHQTFRDFELVAVDDASTDGTAKLLADLAANDDRVRVLTTPRNLGVVDARNFGFAACRGEYIALLDHDDISRPDRLGAQVAYLDAHPDVVLLGTGVLVEARGRLWPDPPSPCDPLGLRWALHLGNPLTWSSVMLRAAAARRLTPFVRPEHEYADDFDLYHRMLALGQVARLDEPLTVYRWHGDNTTVRAADPLFDRAVAVLARAYRPWFGSAADEAAALAIRHISQRQAVRDLATLDRIGEVLERVLQGFTADLASVDQARIAAEASGVWWDLVRSASRSGLPRALLRFSRRPALRRGPSPTAIDWAATLVAGVLRASRPGRALAARIKGRGP